MVSGQSIVASLSASLPLLFFFNQLLLSVLSQAKEWFYYLECDTQDLVRSTHQGSTLPLTPR